MDIERLVLVPIFVFLLVLNGASLWTYRDTIEGGPWLSVAHGILITAFYAMLVVLMFFRAPAMGTTRSARAVAAAYAGSFAPFLLIFNQEVRVSQPLALASTCVMLVGLIITMCGLSYLGRSFGVVPTARRLVRSGPYRLVRHPLYAGEFVTFVGAVMVEVTAFTVAVFVGWVVVQFYRAKQEEEVLRVVFPEYESYMESTARFIPGLL